MKFSLRVWKGSFLLPRAGLEGDKAGGAAPGVWILEVAAGDGLVKHARVMKIRSDELQNRRSACADAALRAEMKRVEKMTVEERIKTALSLGRRFSLIQAPTKGK